MHLDCRLVLLPRICKMAHNLLNSQVEDTLRSQQKEHHRVEAGVGGGGGSDASKNMPAVIKLLQEVLQRLWEYNHENIGSVDRDVNILLGVTLHIQHTQTAQQTTQTAQQTTQTAQQTTQTAQQTTQTAYDLLRPLVQTVALHKYIPSLTSIDSDAVSLHYLVYYCTILFFYYYTITSFCFDEYFHVFISYTISCYFLTF